MCEADPDQHYTTDGQGASKNHQTTYPMQRWCIEPSPWSPNSVGVMQDQAWPISYESVPIRSPNGSVEAEPGSDEDARPAEPEEKKDKTKEKKAGRSDAKKDVKQHSKKDGKDRDCKKKGHGKKGGKH
jgi:hypothetical protein